MANLGRRTIVTGGPDNDKPLVRFVNVISTTSPTEKPGTRGGGLEATADATPGQHSEEPVHAIHSTHTATNQINLPDTVRG